MKEKKIILIAKILHYISMAGIVIIPVFYILKILFKINMLSLTPQINFIFLSIGLGIFFALLLTVVFILIGWCFQLYRRHFIKPAIHIGIIGLELILIKNVLYPLLGIN